MLDKLQKRICRSVGPSLAASLEPLAHHRNAATLSFFYKYYLDVYLNCLNCFHFLILVAGPLVTQIGCTFLSAFLDVIRMSMSTCVYVFQLFLNSFPMSILSFYSSFSCKSIPRSGCSVFHEIKAIWKEKQYMVIMILIKTVFLTFRFYRRITHNSITII